ncbi:hypothetical protein CAEBREN_30054 [Caenorhabditis brenneri]|uniref:G-protein coupled receptors family 1 profile domain-containing protein n=1 Tax=Caenorhabditis brenneri TaxID=135651 RepID=G0N7L0_CAEBE|nr:hypothetical protein CAEBREN_30054 [Caenorhabditis brenneri]
MAYAQSRKESTENGDNGFDTIVGLFVIFFAATGIFANSLVIILSLGHVQGDFRFFVANLAFMDVLCGSVFMFMGYINVNNHHNIPSKFLYYMTLAFYGSFGIMICAIVPISLSRVLALSNTTPFPKMFGHRRLIILCLLLDFVPIGILYLICILEHDIAKLLFYLFAFITTFAYFLAFATNYMAFRVVPAFLTLSSVLLLSEPITNGQVIIITQLWQNCFYCASLVEKRIWKPKNTDNLCVEEKEAFETTL